jgi:hypothetical protein
MTGELDGTSSGATREGTREGKGRFLPVKAERVNPRITTAEVCVPQLKNTCSFAGCMNTLMCTHMPVNLPDTGSIDNDETAMRVASMACLVGGNSGMVV